MKKLLCIVLLAISFTAVQAQFGVKAGLNIANIGGKDADLIDGKKALIGFYAGAFYNIEVSDVISVQPEVVYSGQGAKYDGGKVALAYINITPLVRYNTEGGFFVGVGPQVGILASAKDKPDDGESTDIKDSFKGIDFAAAIAAGFETESGFGAYARYNIGLSSIADDSDVKFTNNVIQVGLRYRFGEKKSK